MPPRQAVASAIQDLAAARIARGLVPVALLFLAGLVQLGAALLKPEAAPSPAGGLSLAVGALLSGGALLAHGQSVVWEAFGRARRPWMSVSGWASFLPFLYGSYVLAWWGLRRLAVGEGLAGPGLGIVFAVLGTWILRAWMRVVELGRLSRLMTVGLEETGGEA